MELMKICEEDSTNAKPFRRQFLFHRIRIEKIIPNLMKENTMLSLLGNYYYLFILLNYKFNYILLFLFYV